MTIGAKKRFYVMCVAFLPRLISMYINGEIGPKARVEDKQG